MQEEILPPTPTTPVDTQTEHAEVGTDEVDVITENDNATAEGPIEEVFIRRKGQSRNPDTKNQAVGLV